MFATDVLDDVMAIGEDARKLRAEAMALYHDNRDADRDPDGFARYRRTVKEWHEGSGA